MKKVLFLYLLPTISFAQSSIETCSDIKDYQQSAECYLELLNKNPSMEEQLIIKEKIDELTKKVSAQLRAWSYNENKDKMRGTSSFMASIASLNEIKLHASYDTAMLGLALRKNTNGNDVILALTGGIFNCRIDGCKISVKFDEGNIESYKMVESSSGNSKTLFVLGDKTIKSFASKLKKAKHLIIEVPIYNYGNAQFEFNVEGLNWEHF